MDEVAAQAPMVTGVPSHAEGRPAMDGASPDAEAVRAVLTGDMAAFEGIVARHERLVYTMLLRLLGNVEEAEDLTQETFVRALQSLRSYDCRRPFRAWLVRIARNLALSSMRRRGRVVSLEDWEESSGPVADPDAGSALEEADRGHRLDRLRRAIDALPGTVRALVQMRYREEMKIGEISEAMEMSPSNVKVVLHRARLRLRALLTGDGPGKKGDRHD